MLILGLLNIVVWVWFLGFIVTLPFMARYIWRTEDTVKVGDIILGIANSAVWFLCLEELMDEIEDSFEMKSGSLSEKFERFMDYDLMKTLR